jgi:nitrate reductase alpha subunit
VSSLLKYTRKKITQDKYAISESFTVLPALAMILIGFTLFSILISSAYSTVDHQQDYNEMFKLSNEILEKISTPNSIITTDENSVRFDDFTSTRAELFIEELQKSYQPYGFSFAVKLSCNDLITFIPPSFLQNSEIHNQYACSKQVTVELNEVTTLPGTLTIVFWKTNS